MPTTSVEAAREWHESTRNRAQRKHVTATPQHGAATDASETFDAARRRLMIANADIADIEAAELRNELLDKKEVDAAVFEIARAMRDGLTNCARRIAAEVSTLTTADACETVIEREHRALLDSMAHQIGVRLGAVDLVPVPACP
ncbi:hypothetical protein [Rhodoferax antarcticus]|uniref:Uncharacterized protein n=1 Tax=Rhodoferax antarcticus ANT.BR TaxID=1111071 RepID=A0A1Q8YAQ8_9BURK|nr:hypothetical protein [Rhodoferax antarcticus]APW47223.1 hypothetical protein RA876_13655 [Rhodoferax antarcticus]OLP05161.1 hypothetical protein BLL52_3982 [Rhodoferax antarcticus ANT.BR]